MPTTNPSESRRVFNQFMRTGRVAEHKYNHHHDDLGRFAFSDGAAGMSSRPNATPEPGRTRAKPVAKPTAAPVALDSLSAGEEAHGGPGTISSGVGDKGGISYGSYQLSTNKVTAAEFVASPEARPWTDRLGGLTPGTPEFGKAWQAVAANDPVGFQAAQKVFIIRTKYDVTVRILAREPFTDISGASPVVKAVIYSSTVQDGQSGAARIVARSVADTDKVMKRSNPGWQALLIRNIYARRISRSLAISMAAAKRGDRKTANNYHSVATGRLPRERDTALASLSGQ